MNRYLLIIIIALTIIGCESKSTYPPDGAEKFIIDLIEKNEIPGLVVAVSKNGKTVWSKGFGLADIEQQVLPDPDKTKFRIGSISKTITSAGLGVLMDQNKIDIDAPIQDYVPYFPRKKYDITVRQAGGHTAGIRHYRGREFYSVIKYDNIRDALAIIFDDTLLFKPGSDYSYSTFGYNLLSAAIEGAGKMEFLSFMQKYVFNPLEMTSTIPDYSDSIILFRSGYYGMDSGRIINAQYVDLSSKWAGGGYLSTASDMLKYGNALLSGSFLSDSTKNELLTPQNTDDGFTTDHGIGWFSGITSNDVVFYGNEGKAVGGRSMFYIYPSEMLVVVILTNDSRVNFTGKHDFAHLFMY